MDTETNTLSRGLDLSMDDISASAVLDHNLITGDSITGMATGTQPGTPPAYTGTNTLSGTIVSGGSGAAYGFYSAPDTIWVDSSGARLSGDVIIRITWARSASGLVDHYAAIRTGLSCGTSSTQEGAQAKFSSCTVGSASSTETGGGSAGSGGFETSAGSTICFAKGANAVAIRTRGSAGEVIRVTNLRRVATMDVTNMGDIPQGQAIILTAQRPEQYGIRAYGLSGDGRVVIRNIQTPGTSGGAVNMDVQVTPATGVERLAFEFFHMNLKTTDSTNVQLAGVGEIQRCSDRLPAGTPCVLNVEPDRVSVRLPQQELNALRITGLSSTTNPCAGKSQGDVCGDPSAGTTCRAPPSADLTLLQCTNPCGYNWMSTAQSIDPSRVPSPGAFCVADTARATCNTEWDTAQGLCPENTKCCPDGSGRVLQPVGGGGASSGLATGTQGDACGLRVRQNANYKCWPESQCQSGTILPDLSRGSSAESLNLETGERAKICNTGLECCKSNAASEGQMCKDSSPPGVCRTSCGSAEELTSGLTRSCEGDLKCCREDRSCAGSDPIMAQWWNRAYTKVVTTTHTGTSEIQCPEHQFCVEQGANAFCTGVTTEAFRRYYCPQIKQSVCQADCDISGGLAWEMRATQCPVQLMPHSCKEYEKDDWDQPRYWQSGQKYYHTLRVTSRCSSHSTDTLNCHGNEVHIDGRGEGCFSKDSSDYWDPYCRHLGTVSPPTSRTVQTDLCTSCRSKGVTVPSWCTA